MRPDVFPQPNPPSGSAALAAGSRRDIVAGAALARERLEEDDSALDAWLKELRPLKRKGVLNLAVLMQRPRALARGRFTAGCWPSLWPRDLRQGFEDLLTAALAGQRTRRSLGCNGFAVVRDSTLRFERVRHRRKRARSGGGGES